jgi:hypothetical protein
MILAIVMCTGEASAVLRCSGLLMQTTPASLQDSIYEEHYCYTVVNVPLTFQNFKFT